MESNAQITKKTAQKENTKATILEIKKVVEENGWTPADVLELVTACGEQTSESSVRRVLEEGSEDKGFNYRLTIKPIAKAILKITERDIAVEDRGEVAALKEIILAKETETNRLVNNLQVAELNLKAKEEKIESLVSELEYSRNSIIPHLKQELAENKENRERVIASKNKEICRARRFSLLFAVLFALALFVIIAALVVDRINPNMGFFWLDRVSAFITGENMSFTLSGL